MVQVTASSPSLAVLSVGAVWTSRLWRTDGTSRTAGPGRPSLRPDRRSFRFGAVWCVGNAWSDVRLFVDMLHCQFVLTVHSKYGFGSIATS